jgi:hypothetical protein
MMKSLHDESGQALIIVALSLTSLLGFVGLAVDVGALLHDRRELQIAADSAAIAGALSYNYGGSTNAAYNASARNGFTNGQNGASVTVNSPPQHGGYINTGGYIEVIVQQSESTIFMGLFGHGKINVAARAVAGTSHIPGAGCIYTIGATGSDFLVNGNANIQSPQCGLEDDSTSSNALLVNGNITMNLGSIGVVGGYSKNGNVSVTPAPVTGIIPYSDPLSFLPGYTCGANSCTNGSTTIPCVADPNISGNHPNLTITPGCYKGLTLNGNYTVTMNAGTYIINGGNGLLFNGNGTISGTGVTVYMAQSGVTVNGNTALNLAAPTTGTYSGILFAQSPTDTSAATINGNASTNIQGIMYFPAANLTINGNSSTTMYTDFISQSLTLNGNVSFDDYASLSGVNSPLNPVTLVE